MLGMGRDVDATAISRLEDELEHLKDILEAGRVLPRRTVRAAGACQVAIVVPSILRLIESSLEEPRLDIAYEGPDDGVMVALDETTVSHSLAALLMCLVWRARFGEAVGITARLSTCGAMVEFHAGLLRAQSRQEAAEPVHGRGIPPEWLIREGLESVAASAMRAGGALEWDDLVLPSSFRYRLPRLV